MMIPDGGVSDNGFDKPYSGMLYPSTATGCRQRRLTLSANICWPMRLASRPYGSIRIIVRFTIKNYQRPLMLPSLV